MKYDTKRLGMLAKAELHLRAKPKDADGEP